MKYPAIGKEAYKAFVRGLDGIYHALFEVEKASSEMREAKEGLAGYEKAEDMFRDTQAQLHVLASRFSAWQVHGVPVRPSPAVEGGECERCGKMCVNGIPTGGTFIPRWYHLDTQVSRCYGHGDGPVINGKVQVDFTNLERYEWRVYKLEPPKCSAHGEVKCDLCSLNGPTCDECGVYDTTGMHWDTCPRRIRSYAEAEQHFADKARPPKDVEPLNPVLTKEEIADIFDVPLRMPIPLLPKLSVDDMVDAAQLRLHVSPLLMPEPIPADTLNFEVVHNPYIARTVHYVDPSSGCIAAIITGVNGDTVNLTAFSSAIQMHNEINRSSVLFSRADTWHPIEVCGNLMLIPALD